MRERSSVLVLLVAALAAAAFADGDDEPPAPPGPVVPVPPAAPRACRIEVIAKGEGREVKKDDIVLAHLVVKLKEGGRLLMDTHLEKDPQALPVGSYGLPEGLDKVIQTMRQGDHWKVDAPWEQAWGANGYQRFVPPRADVLVDVEIVGFLELKIENLKQGAGAVPVPGEYVLVHYTAAVEGGKVYDDSRKADVPTVLVMGDGTVVPGFETTMRRMRVGDRVKATIPWQWGFGAQGVPQKGIPPKANLTFDIERLPLPEIRHEVLKTGDGARCLPGREILIHYTGTFVDGRKFESSRDHDEPMKVLLGVHGVMPGWELTIAKMRVGDRWRFTVPWLLAYGTTGRAPSPGRGEIPPRSDLVFDLEVLSQK